MLPETAPRTVLVVEDDPTICAAIEARLLAEGYAVRTAADGPSAVAGAAASPPDLVVLDVMLPGFDGYEVCRRIQAQHPVPVLMLTARTDESDLLVGLGVGADDYMTKPFSPRELVARVSALLRRVERARSLAVPDTPGVLQVGDVAVDRDAHRVHRDGVEVHLTPTEFDILVCPAERPRAVLSREQLLGAVRDWAEPAGPRAVDSHVKALRRKLGADVVRTVHGVGYAAGSS